VAASGRGGQSGRGGGQRVTAPRARANGSAGVGVEAGVGEGMTR
jgi:hypothetical protein